MRTTIELKDEHRARLLEMAARQGKKGFSDLIGEAIEAFLTRIEERGETVERALAARGSLGEREGVELGIRAQGARDRWR
jgi:predicted transcriptional regulator